MNFHILPLILCIVTQFENTEQGCPFGAGGIASCTAIPIPV